MTKRSTARRYHDRYRNWRGMETKSNEELRQQLDDALKEVDVPTSKQKKVIEKKVAGAKRKLGKLKRSKYPLRRRLERMVKNIAKPFPELTEIQSFVEEKVEADYSGDDEPTNIWASRVYSLEVDDVIEAYEPLIQHEQEFDEEPTEEEMEEVEAVYELARENAKDLGAARLAVALDHGMAWARAHDKTLYEALRRAEENEAFLDVDEALRRASETVKGNRSASTELKDTLKKLNELLDGFQQSQSGRLTDA